MKVVLAPFPRNDKIVARDFCKAIPLGNPVYLT
jgi:hypothetical protein